MVCPNCKRKYEPMLAIRRKPSIPVQKQFPRASAELREQLISGICSNKCWDKFLGIGD